MKYLRRIALLLCLLVVLALLGACAVLFTEAGTRSLVSVLPKMTGGMVQVGGVQGRLGSSLSLRNLQLHPAEETTVAVDTLQFDWSFAELFRKRLHIRNLRCTGLHVDLPEKKKEEPQKPELPSDIGVAVELPDISLPLDIVIDTFSVKDTTIRQKGAEPLTLLEAGGGLQYIDSRLQLRQLFLTDPEYSARLSGDVTTTDAWPLTLQGRASAAAGAQRYEGSLDISGTLKSGECSIVLAAPFTARLQGTFSINQTLAWALTFSLDEFDVADFAPDTPGQVTAQGYIQGNLQKGNPLITLQMTNLDASVADYDFRGDADISYDTGLHIKRLLVRGAAAGSMSGSPGADIAVPSLQIHGDVGNTLSLQGHLEAADLAAALPQLHGQITGDFQVTGELQAPDLTLQADAEKLAGNGFSAGDIHLSVDAGLDPAKEAHLQLQGEELLLGGRNFSRAGLTAQGTLRQQQVELSLTAAEGSGPSLRTNVEGGVTGGNWKGSIKDLVFAIPDREDFALAAPVAIEAGKDGVRLGDFCLRNTSGSLCGNALFENQAWKAALQLISFNPAYLMPDADGDISLQIRSDGDLHEKRGTLLLSDVSGTLLGKTLDGGGEVQFAQDSFSFQDFALRVGNARLSVTGNAGDKNTLNFVVTVPELSELVSAASGTISLQGMLLGDLRHPLLHADLDGSGLQFQDKSLSGITGRADIDLGEAGTVSLDLAAEGLHAGTRQLDTVAVRASGSAAKHTFSVAGQGPDGDLALSGVGAWLDDSWNGKLLSLTGTLPVVGAVTIPAPADLSFGGGNGGVTGLCLDYAGGSTCADVTLKEGDAVFSGKVTGVDLEKLDLTDLAELKGMLFADVSGSIVKGKPLQLDAGFRGDDVRVHGEVDSEKVFYRFDTLGGKLHLADNALALTLQAHEADGKGGVQLDLQSARPVEEILSNIMKTPLQGALRLDLNDLSFAGLLTDDLLILDGRINADMTLAGSLSAPVLQGDINLLQGTLTFPDYCMVFSYIGLAVDATATKIGFDLQGDAGKGHLVAHGDFNYGNGAPWNLAIKGSGKDLELLNRDDLTLVAGGTFSFDCDAERGLLKADLSIPHGRIVMEDQEQSLITPSSDVVIVNPADKTAREGWKMQTHLNIDLGDDTTFKGYGLRGRLTGELLYESVTGKNPTALGEISLVDGHFKLYTSDLDIGRGLVHFTGGMVDNPGIDFQAVRTIDDETEVGVNVSGTLDDMHYELFSDPVMEETDIIAYLAVGKLLRSGDDDDDDAIGTALTTVSRQLAGSSASDKLEKYLFVDDIELDGGTSSQDMALMVGKNLTDRLYIGYSHNFYEGNGEFKARYKLGHGFSVETESSSESTGGDLLFSIER